MRIRIVIFLLLTSINFIFSQNEIINKRNLNTYLQGICDSIPQNNFNSFVDEKNDLNFVLVVDNINLDKEQIYNRLLSYFVYNYKDSKSVLQVKDKEAGLIIGKGIYMLGSYVNKVTAGLSTSTFVSSYSTYHILRVDIKEKKVRIIVSASNYDVHISNMLPGLSEVSIRIVDTEPFKTVEQTNLKGISKKMQQEAFETAKNIRKNVFRQLVKRFIVTQLEIEKLLKENGTSKETENW